MPIANVTRKSALFDAEGTAAWGGNGGGDAETELVPPPELAWSEDDELHQELDVPPMPLPSLPFWSWRATVGIAAAVLAASGVIAAVVVWPDNGPAATVPTPTTTQVPTQAVAPPVLPPAPPTTATVTVAVPAPTVTATVTQQPAAQSTPRVAAPPRVTAPLRPDGPHSCIDPDGIPTPRVRSPYEGGGYNC